MKRIKQLIITNEELMSEWDWEANDSEGYDPNKISLGSGISAHWVCKDGHHWRTQVQHRTTRGSGCPYCKNKRILIGYNDLKSQRPDLMKEWDPNNTTDPEMISCGSNKKVKWICSKGHKYEKSVASRVNGSECPTCNKGLGTSFPEQCYFYYIKKHYPDSINRYRAPFKNKTELDIYIPSIKTAIEYDGIFWHGSDSVDREVKKYDVCKENGIRLFRIKEGEFTGFKNSADRTWYIPRKCDSEKLNFYITELLKQLSFFSTNLPDVNIERDRNEILEYKTLKYKDSLEAQYPDVAKEWHPTKNGSLLPSSFPPGTSESAWWLCSKCGNEWKTAICNRTSGHGCNVCATGRRMVTRKHNILEKRGSVNVESCLLDWDYENNEHGPEYYTNGSGEIIAWKCHTCGYKWKTPLYIRIKENGSGCPSCSGSAIVEGINDLYTLRPDLMEEWSLDNTIDPKRIGIGSKKIRQLGM